MSRVGGKIRVGRVTPIQQFFFFWPNLRSKVLLDLTMISLDYHNGLMQGKPLSNAQPLRVLV